MGGGLFIYRTSDILNRMRECCWILKNPDEKRGPISPSVQWGVGGRTAGGDLQIGVPRRVGHGLRRGGERASGVLGKRPEGRTVGSREGRKCKMVDSQREPVGVAPVNIGGGKGGMLDSIVVRQKSKSQGLRLLETSSQ